MVLGWTLAAVAGATCFAFTTPALRVTKARLYGPEALTRAAERHVPLGRNMLAVRMSSVAKAMETDLRVAEARIKREPPGKLSVRLVPRVPLAQVRLTSGAYGLVDRTGLVFERHPSQADLVLLNLPDGLTGRVGASVSPGHMKTARRVIDEARRQDLAGLRKLDFLPDGRVNAVLQQGLVVKLGFPVNLSAKLAVAAATMRDISPADIEYLDTELPDSVVMLPRGRG